MKKYEEYQLTTNQLLLYILDLVELKHLVMDEFHRRPYVGHLGYQKMITIVR
jgi:hypothetical protein